MSARALLALSLLGAAACAIAADRAEPLPDDLAGVGITEHLGEHVPLDLAFIDSDGNAVTLADYCDGSRPVILNLLYLRCPMLCGLISHGLTDALKQMKQTVGDEFTVLSVSFDPSEGPQLAQAQRERYFRDYGRPGAAAGWHWLAGEGEAIRRLTETVGFGYRWNEERQEFAHAAVLIILTPDGEISRYLYGVVFDPRTLELSLVEAADGKTGTTVDRFILFCFHYDAAKGRYGPAAQNLMKIGGLLAILVLAALVLRLSRRRTPPI